MKNILKIILMVIFIYQSENGNYYSVSDANNRGEITYKSWNELVENYPRFKGLENIFTPQDLIPKEKDEYDLIEK